MLYLRAIFSETLDGLAVTPGEGSVQSTAAKLLHILPSETQRASTDRAPDSEVLGEMKESHFTLVLLHYGPGAKAKGSSHPEPAG